MDKRSGAGGKPGDHVNELLSGYLDGELTQQQRQRVGLHIEGCEACAANLNDLQDLHNRIGKAGLGEGSKDIWREKMDDTAVQLSQGIGWLLLIGGMLFVAGIVIVSFILDPSISVFMKLVISAVYLGFGALFVSVLRQRLIERKSDKYKDVEI